MKEAAKKLGFADWQSFNAHCLRKWFITELVNDSDVNIKDSMEAARHMSISAHKVYIEKNYQAEYKMLLSVGLIGKKTPIDMGMFQHLLHMSRQIFENANIPIPDELKATFEKQNAH